MRFMNRLSPYRNRGGAVALAVAIMLAGAASRSRAEDFAPDLGETLDWLAREAAPLAEPGDPAPAPTGSPEVSDHAMSAERTESLLEQLPGRPFNVVDPKPQSRAYWKYPIYLVIGLPRDAVDTVFGFFSFWPIVNIPVVGVVYETAPTQFIMRDPRDWHRWPFGRRNPKTKHGFIDGQSWGWFPTARSMKFVRDDEKKLERYEAENDEMRKELEALNKGIESKNRKIAQAQREARNAAIAAIDAGDGKTAVSWALPYRLAYPGDETAQALLINALALQGDGGPEWVRPMLWRELSRASLRVVRQAESLVAKTQSDFPTRLTLAEALVYARTRLGEDAEALAVAEEAYQAGMADPRRARLYCEAAITARQPEKAALAAAKLQTLEPGDPDLPLLKLRLSLLEGKADAARPALWQLSDAAPENPYYLYYVGCADLALSENSDAPEIKIQDALDNLERSSLLAGPAPLQERVGRALSFTRGLSADKSEKKPAKKKNKGMQLNVKF